MTKKQRMATADKLHKEAMENADYSFMLWIKNRDTKDSNILRAMREYDIQAWRKESAAAKLVEPLHDMEPTRSVLHRSASWMAYSAKKLDDAGRLAVEGLNGKNAPAEIVEELRDALVAIARARHQSYWLKPNVKEGINDLNNYQFEEEEKCH